MRDFVVTQSIWVETYKNPRPKGFYDLWIAEWRPKDDPSYHEDERSASTEDGPTIAYGRTRGKALRNAKRILAERAQFQAKRLRLERESEDSTRRHRVEFDVTTLRLEESNG